MNKFKIVIKDGKPVGIGIGIGSGIGNDAKKMILRIQIETANR